MKFIQRKKFPAYLAAAALVLFTIAGFAVAAGESGSASDPLVSLSYLNNVFKPALLANLETTLAPRDAALKDELTAKLDVHMQEINAKLASVSSSGAQTGAERAATYSVVTLTSGQTLTGKIGTEVMLRVGTATCVADSAPGMINITTGGTINAGAALEANHLYMITIDTRGVKATAATVKLLVRGEYTVA